MRRIPLLPKLFLFRVINALLCQTFFQPDEFYQSLEVAHRIVFGFGWKTWEWRQSAAIRSPLHPLLFVPAYWIVEVLGLEHTSALIILPKVFQAFPAAIIDYSTAKLASNLFPGHLHAEVALLCSLLSFFNGGVAVRTFSNSLEAALTVAAMSLWPWSGTGRYTASLWLAGLACILRPTNAIIWLYMALSACIRGSSYTTRLLKNLFLPLIGCITICALLDRWFYGRWTFTPYNFFRTNVVSNISLFYGGNPWHFYLTQALPFDTIALLPFVCHGFYLSWTRSDWPKAVSTARNVCLWTIAVLSLISHKEFRFIQPLLPIFHILAAASLIQLSKQARIEPEEKSNATARSVRRRYFWLICLINIPAIIIFNLVHMRGQVDVTRYLHNLPAGRIRSLGFFMPCHSTPWHSHLHLPELEQEGTESGYGGRLWALTCEPPLNGNALTYRDETDVFYSDPHTFLKRYFPAGVNPSFPSSPGLRSGEDSTRKYEWPSHLVVFDVLLQATSRTSNRTISQVLAKKGYVESKRIWNSWWHEDPNRAGDIVVFEHSSLLS